MRLIEESDCGVKWKYYAELYYDRMMSFIKVVFFR